MVVTGSAIADFFIRDTGQLSQVLSNYKPDSEDYIQAADNYLEFGVFGHQEIPDYHRPVGYPSFIFICKIVLGDYWYYGLVVFQTILGVLIYPLIYKIGIAFFPGHRSSVFVASVMCMAFGAFLTKSPQTPCT